MPFTFKLSQRLARMRRAVVLFSTLLAACELGSTNPTTADQPVARVLVTPDSVALDPLQTYQFHTFGRTATGDSVAIAVTWSASVGSITQTGFYTADTSTSDAVITAALKTNSTVSATTRVRKKRLVEIDVTPSSATVPTGGAQQFDVYGTKNTGDSVSVSVTYSASGGTVSGSGMYTAGQVAGGYRVIAKQSGGTLADTATVTVTAVLPPPPPPPPSDPGTVTDLAVASVSDSSVTLSFTEVTDGTGQPASYDIRWAAGPLAWGSATEVARGTCQVPMSGTAIGAKRSCTVLGLAAGTSYQFQLLAYRGTLNLDAVFGGFSNVASGTTTASTAPVATVTVSPASASVVVGAVQQLTAILKDASGNTLTGRTVTWGTSASVLATVSTGGLVTGVAAGPVTITATSEGKSSTAAITVTPVGSGGVVFESDWSTATGTSYSAVSDGNRWMNYWEFNNGTGVQLMSVVSGGPGGRNALKVVQRGPNYAANVQQDNVLPPSTDYYVRYYMRNDDTSPAGDHIVTVDTWQYANLTYMRRWGVGSGWQFVSSFYGCGYTYPIGHWGPNLTLTYAAWYRFEYYVHFVDATHVQVHPRVYDASGTQILGDADFQQSDWGNQIWNGRNDWTLASYYAAGYSFCVDPTWLTHFGMGNNGQYGAADTGLAWYFAGVQIRTDRWPGP